MVRYANEKEEGVAKGKLKEVIGKLILLWRMKLSDNSIGIQYIVHMSDNFH